MLKAILILIVVAVAGVLVLAAMKPDTFKVQRSASIKAPPEKVFPLINDFKSWGAWSPWEKKDPQMKRTFSASTSGKDATYSWQGNKDVGEGGMKIVESNAPRNVKLSLDFMKPFEAHNTVDFTLQPGADGTTVVWAMEGPTPFFGKIIHVFMDMDAMVGRDFEAGLAALRNAAEKEGK